MPKYVNPGLGEKRIADTSGHVVFIGQEPVNIMEHMEPEARKLGCISIEENTELQTRIKDQHEEEFKKKYGIVDEPEEKPSLDAGDLNEPDELEKRAKVKEIMESMLDSEDESYFTTHDKPRADIVEEKCGFPVDKALREEMWLLIKAEQA